ncbi:MAG TPA: diacylglycerol kinase family protein [Candidatus Angelobacter sp.]
MTTVALLHPNVAPCAVEPFRSATSTITIRETLDGSEPPDAAVIFGGDGTVHRYLPQLRQSGIPALVVPKGSGNDFAKALGIFSEKAALRAWKEFCSTGKNVREIDLGIVVSGETEIPFCCVAGTGLDSAANARANRMPVWLRGSAGYFIAALQALASLQPARFAVSAAGRELRERGFFVAVGNAHRYGRGMKVAPRAALDDGLLDVCLVGDMSKLKLLCCVPTVFFGAHLGIQQVEYFQAPGVRIDTDRPLEVYANGEYVCHTPVEIKLAPAALKVIVPG